MMGPYMRNCPRSDCCPISSALSFHVLDHSLGEGVALGDPHLDQFAFHRADVIPVLRTLETGHSLSAAVRAVRPSGIG